MSSMLYVEWIKVKRSKWGWLIILTLLAQHGIEYSAIVQQTSPSRLTWEWTYYIHYRLLITGIFPILLSLLMGYVIISEFRYNTISNVLTYPYSRSAFLLGKYIVAILILSVTLLVDFVMTAGVGLLAGFEPMTMGMWQKSITVMLMLLPMMVAFMPLYAYSSLFFGSYLANATLGVLVVVFCEIIWDRLDYSIMFPWTIPAVIVGDQIGILNRDITQVELWQGIVWLTGIFIVFLILSFLHIQRKDIHTQNL